MFKNIALCSFLLCLMANITKGAYGMDDKIVVLETSQGTIELKLMLAVAPRACENFIGLVEKGYYNGLIFHRVIKGFMIQGGDPNGDGTGNPGYRFNDEKFEGDYVRGTVAMANAGPNTNGSQFFIMHKDQPLPKSYVIFGKVTEGLDVVDKIATAETTVNENGEKSKPAHPVKILTINIIEN